MVFNKRKGKYEGSGLLAQKQNIQIQKFLIISEKLKLLYKDNGCE